MINRRTFITLDNGRTYPVEWQPTTLAQLRVLRPRGSAKACAPLITFRIIASEGSVNAGAAPSQISAANVLRSTHLTGIVTRSAFTAAGGEVLPVA